MTNSETFCDADPECANMFPPPCGAGGICGRPRLSSLSWQQLECWRRWPILAKLNGTKTDRTILSSSPPRTACGWTNAIPVWLGTSGSRGQEPVAKPDLDVVEPRYVLPHEMRRRSCFDYASGLDEGAGYDPSVVRHAEATVAHLLGSVSFRAVAFGKLGPSTPPLKLSPGQRYPASATLRREHVRASGIGIVESFAVRHGRGSSVSLIQCSSVQASVDIGP